MGIKAMPGTRAYRRVVTGLSNNGKSTVVSDTTIPVSDVLAMVDFWFTDGVPASLAAHGEPDGRHPRLEPPRTGTIFRLFEIPAQPEGLTPSEAQTRAAQEFARAGAAHCQIDTSRHPMMHRTRTIDYVVVLRGRVTLLLDEAEVDLQPFDAVVQRGTNHYWVNRNPEPALLLGVLLDAQ